MKNLCVLALIGILLIVPFGDVSAEHDVYKKSDIIPHEYSLKFRIWRIECEYLNDKWSIIKLKDGQSQWEQGKPNIPYRVIHFQTPQPIEKVILRLGKIERTGNIKIVPQIPYYLPGLETFDYTRPLIDERIYNNDRFYPSEWYSLHKVGEGKKDDGQHIYIYNLVINPIRYNPKREIVEYVRDAKITVYYSEKKEYYSLRASEEKYIIITSDAINASGVLNPLVEWKTKKGLSAHVYTVEWISANYQGYDTPEKIRNFLKIKYRDSGLEWVQLVGDVDAVPTRKCKNPWPIQPYDDDWMPADTYYACLDWNSTWDAYDNDHVYGELFDTDGDHNWDHYDLDDAYPDVWVARIAISSTSKLQKWVQNVLTYEKNPPTGRWMDTTVCVAPDAGNAGNAQQVAAKMEEFIVGNNIGQYGYLKKLYGHITRLYEANGTLSRSSFKSAFNSGAGFITWIAHGEVYRIISSGFGTIMSSNDVSTLRNGGKKPTVFGMSCLTNWFDGKECFGEALTEGNLDNGAIAYVGSARITLANVQPGYQASGVGIQMDFMYQMELGKTLDNNRLYAGKALLCGKGGFAEIWFPFWEAATKAFFEYNLLGETNCPIWTDTPRTFNFHLDVNKTPQGTIATILTTDSQTGQPLNNTTVCITNTQGYYYSAKTNLQGKLVLQVPPGIDSVNIVLTRADYKPYMGTANLVDDMPPHTQLIVNPVEPDGENGWYKTSPTISFSSEEGAVTYYRWDEEQYETYSQPFRAPEGIHTLYYYSEDYAKNKEEERRLTFKVDTITPSSEYNVTPWMPDGFNDWYVTQPTVTLSCDESDAKIMYKWDIGKESVYKKALKVPVGIHTLYYYSIDDAGNKEKTHKLKFKVDIDVPRVNCTVSPWLPNGENGWYKDSPKISFSSEDETSASTVYYWWDDDEIKIYTSSFSAPEGEHTLHYYAIDDAGNKCENLSIHIKVDSKAPIVVCEISPSEPNGNNDWYITKPIVTLSTPNETSRIYYSMDDEDYVEYTEDLIIPDGRHKLKFYAIDEAGNRGNVSQKDFKVDTVPPTTNIIILPDDLGDEWYTRSTKVKLDADGASEIYYYWDDDEENVKVYTDEIGVPEGVHTLYYYSMDYAGNKEDIKSKTFKVDKTPPMIKISLPSEMNLSESLTITIHSEDKLSGVDSYYIDFGDGTIVGWTSENSATHIYPRENVYEVIIKVKDVAGNIGIKKHKIKVLKVQTPIGDETEGGAEATSGLGVLLPIAVGSILLLIIIAGGIVYAVKRRKKDIPPQETSYEMRKELMPAHEWAREVSTTYDYTSEEGIASTTPSEITDSTCPKCGNYAEPNAGYCLICGHVFGDDVIKESPVEYDISEAPEAALSPSYLHEYETPSHEDVPTEEYEYVPSPEEKVVEYEDEVPTVAQEKKDESDITRVMTKLEMLATEGTEDKQTRKQIAKPRIISSAAPSKPRIVSVERTEVMSEPQSSQSPPMHKEAAGERTDKECQKCGARGMIKIVDLGPGQEDKLRKLSAKGMAPFKCPVCGHFMIGKI